jgi:hypothetical protein
MKLIHCLKPKGKLEQRDVITLSSGITATGYYDEKGNYYEKLSTGQWMILKD